MNTIHAQGRHAGAPPPDFVIIGAMKAGTTSLYAHLTALPGAGPASTKELQYFSFRWHRSLDWYLDEFPTGVVTGEASPQYLFHPLAAERCASVLPNVKLIVLLRNPVERAYSHYRFEVNRNHETLATFEEALDAEAERLASVAADQYDTRANAASRFSYCARGYYADQLERWLKFYKPEQLRIVETSDLERKPRQVVSDLAEWLSLPPPPLGEAFKRENIGSYEVPMSAETRDRLRAHFAHHNQRLYEMLGRDLGWD